MVGRLFSGFGSARALNRRYIADTYPSRERTAASAAFVTAGALGTSAGPAIAATLYYIIPESSVNPFWQVENVPCWVMAGIWAVYLVCLYYFFKEPPRTIASEFVSSSRLKLSTSYESERRSLLGNGSGLAPVRPLYRNIPVMMTFLIYFVLKFLLESLLSSTATLTDLYFEWEGNVAGTYLAVLGLLVLPANGVVAFLAQSYDDRELMLATECFMLTGCLAILHYVGTTYTMEQYMLGSFLIFVSTNALEGPTMSLLSKTIPPYYSRGVLNVGLLATEAGTLGRAVGDIILTICGARGLEYILNNAFGSMAVLSIGTMVLTRYFYDHLEPLEEYGSHKS
jgi:MFS family permease